ncbi:MAG: hypothetical protein LC115_00560 [Bacteroidia bacterium]|nr:hypothetical protein [Bacteroidia bacterium]
MQPTQTNYNLLDLIQLILRWWKIIAIVGIISFLLAVIITLPAIWERTYSSQAILYPINKNRGDLNYVLGKNEFDIFGSGDDVNRMIEIGESDAIAFRVIYKLKLFDHYEIDSTKTANFKFDILEEFRNNIEISRTDAVGVKIIVEDKDPKIAADICNQLILGIEQEYDSIALVQLENVTNLYKVGLQAKQIEETHLYDSLRLVRNQYNVFHYERQTEALIYRITELEAQLSAAKVQYEFLLKEKGEQSPETKQALMDYHAKRTIVDNLTKPNSNNQINLSKFREGVDKVLSLESLIGRTHHEVEDLKNRYDRAILTMQNSTNTIYIMEKPYPADKHIRPKRMAVAIIMVLLSTLLTMVIILFLEHYKSLRNEIKQ